MQRKNLSTRRRGGAEKKGGRSRQSGSGAHSAQGAKNYLAESKTACRMSLDNGHAEFACARLVTVQCLVTAACNLATFAAAQIAVNDVAQAVDYEGGWVGFDEIARGDVGFGANQQREVNALGARKVFDRGGILADIQPEEHKAALFPIEVHSFAGAA